jgi:hypothetical protein
MRDDLGLSFLNTESAANWIVHSMPDDIIRFLQLPKTMASHSLRKITANKIQSFTSSSNGAVELDQVQAVPDSSSPGKQHCLPPERIRASLNPVQHTVPPHNQYVGFKTSQPR